MGALESLTAYYESHDEGNRLSSRHGQVEFLTTTRYIEKYLRAGMRLLEIGAGTGRYAHALARAGYEVDAVELIEHNIELFRADTRPGERISVRQGDATNLDFVADDQYDMTLLLGPMYHLYEDAERARALSEALRVTKPGGYLYVAYCSSDASIVGFGFVRGNAKMLIEKGLLDPATFRTRSTCDELFALCRKSDVEAMTKNLPARRLHYVGTDMATRYIKGTVDQMDEETYSIYLNYHFSICERSDLVGASHHALDILQKTEG